MTTEPSQYPTEQQIIACLLAHPLLADLGKAFSGVRVENGKVGMVIELPASMTPKAQEIHEIAKASILGLTGVDETAIVMTAHEAAPAPAAPKPDMPDLSSSTDQSASSRPSPAGPPPELFPQKKPQPKGPEPIPGVAHVIAVSSGKGGVGKSTIAANLATALAMSGVRTGLLDADVYGPSQPRMLGVSGRPSSPDGNVILPLRNHGVTLMSLGLMAAEDEAIIWRGPMLIGALQQMLTQVRWGRLDVLIVDLPPGTGDVQMSLAQKTRLDGAIVVSTPQDIALIDARKGIDMFARMDVPVMGLVENMASFLCDGCGKIHHPFGHGGARAEAEKLGVPLLAEIPLDLEIRQGADQGTPIVALKPDSLQSKGFFELADAVRHRLGLTEDAHVSA